MTISNLFKNIVHTIKNIKTSISTINSNISTINSNITALDDMTNLYTTQKSLSSGSSWTVPLPTNYRGVFITSTIVENVNAFGIYALARQSGTFQYVKAYVAAGSGVIAWSNTAGNANPKITNNGSYTLTILIIGNAKL